MVELNDISSFLETKDKFLVTASEVYDYWASKDWLTRKGTPIRDIKVMCSVANGLKKNGLLNRKPSSKVSGKKVTEKQCLSQSKKLLRKTLSGNFKGAKKKRVLKDINNKRGELVNKRTQYEKTYEEYLKGLNKKYLIQAPLPIKVGNKVYTTYPDFLLYCQKPKVIIEIDGEYHNTEHYKQWDRIKDKKWSDMGYKVIRYTNSDIINKNYLKETFAF